MLATVRRPSDGEALKAAGSERLHPLLMDVTDPATITQAVHTVSEHSGSRLYGLVNNAGIATGGPLECLSIDAIRQVLEVNVIGLMAVTQAFLPFFEIRKGTHCQHRISLRSGPRFR